MSFPFILIELRSLISDQLTFFKDTKNQLQIPESVLSTSNLGPQSEVEKVFTKISLQLFFFDSLMSH